MRDSLLHLRVMHAPRFALKYPSKFAWELSYLRVRQLLSSLVHISVRAVLGQLGTGRIVPQGPTNMSLGTTLLDQATVSRSQCNPGRSFARREHQ